MFSNFIKKLKEIYSYAAERLSSFYSWVKRNASRFYDYIKNLSGSNNQETDYHEFVVFSWFDKE